MTAAAMFTLLPFSSPAWVPQKPGVRQIAVVHPGNGGFGVVCTHPDCGLQVSIVQAFWSSQKEGGFGVYTHPVAGTHVSSVQALLSLHVMGVCMHPVAGAQVSVVQRLPSSQDKGV
jgi:hypothetical protein